MPKYLTPGLVATIVLLLTLTGCQGAPLEPEEIADTSLLADTVGRGSELYVVNCQMCHGDQQGQGGIGAPPHNQGGHTWHHPDAQLKDWVMNGKLGLGQMPGFEEKLTDSEIDQILTYIKTWWSEDQREAQADVSQRYQEALDKQKQGQ